MKKVGKNIHLFILDSTVTGCVSISAFASLTGIPVGIASSVVGIKMCGITSENKKRRRNTIE